MRVIPSIRTLAGVRSVLLAIAAVTVIVRTDAAGSSPPQPPQAETPRLAARIDPYSARVRILVLTDIANEPDDQMSMVRFLVVLESVRR